MDVQVGPARPEASTRMSTRPSAGRGSGTSRISQLSLKRVMTAARMLPHPEALLR